MTAVRAKTDFPKAVLTALGIVVALTIFAIDIALPPTYIVADLYVVVVLASGLSRSLRAVIFTAIGTLALTWAGFFIQLSKTPPGELIEHLVERGLATLMIGLSVLVVALILVREARNAELNSALSGVRGEQAESDRMLAAASEIAPIGTWSIDLEDELLTLSEQAAAMYGAPVGARPARQEVLSRLEPADAKLLSDRVDDALARNIPFRIEVRMTPPGGTPRWIVAMGDGVRTEAGIPPRIRGTVQDITIWKQAELSANFESRRLTKITSALPIIVWTATPDGLIDFFNATMASFTGIPVDQLLADGWRAVVHPEDLGYATERWERSLDSGERYDVDFRVERADGRYLWHQISAYPELGEGGLIVGWLGSAVDIDAARTLKVRADELAAERETILESMNDGVYALDEDYCVVYMNASAEEILGLGRNGLVGRSIWDAFPDSGATPAADVIRGAMSKGIASRITYKSVILDKWLDLSVTRNSAGVTVFLRDITEVKSLGEKLSQSQRLESVGQLTGGIAHDFNNLLTVVLGGADALTDDESLSSDAQEMAEMIGVAATRGAELTHRLLAFARMQPLEPQSVDLAKRLRSLRPLLRRTLGEDVSMMVGPSTGSALAQVDPGQYDNAVLNLCINARDAMPHGGTLSIETVTTTIDETYVTEHAEVAPGSYAVTTVTDSGEGIPPEDLGRLFDPFFTTKETGKGSGLGLAMVWGFVKQSGGHITVYTESGIGTSFKMYLPSAQAAPEPDPPTSDQIPLQAVSGTILIAEDDDLVRRFAAERLRSRGYDVVEAASGPEAIEALRSLDHIDLLFTDVIMPGGMSGRDLAEAVEELRPGTPVLYASGYTENVILHNGKIDQGVKLLAKPYSARQLFNRVGELALFESEEQS
ncbi:PAS domain S-box protein [Demequina aurantiaca]|uniref:hybrid sensor histidine kinase/response regulator n=1 Tax=Demequina aurantiaca TaxID=676200 RepID=UPI003D3458D9